MNEVEDEQIIALFWEKDEQAIKETEHKYGAYCFQVAYNILFNKQDSEECVSDTWWKAWNRIPPNRPSYLRLYLAKITRNLSFDKYRLQTAKKRGGGQLEMALQELDECLPHSVLVEQEYEKKELIKSINHFLHQLPQRECDVFLRRYFYVESVSQIAKRYSLKESNVYIILSRTRQKLKVHLEKEDYIL